MKIEQVLKFELSPIPTSMFNENGLLRPAKTKSDLQSIGSTISFRNAHQPNLVLIDGCAVLYIVNWPTEALVQDFVENMCSFIISKLKISDTAVVFDRYHDFSIKSSKRMERQSGLSRSHMLTLTSPLPPKNVTVGSSLNKVQLIKLICIRLIAIVPMLQQSNFLLITDPEPNPIQIQNGVVITRYDLQTTHEEADLILVQQAYKSVLENKTNFVTIISDDTDVFVLLSYFYFKLDLRSSILMQLTTQSRYLIDIGSTVAKNIDIIPRLLAAHALSGCDTAAPYHGIGKLKVIKKLREGALVEVLRALTFMC